MLERIRGLIADKETGQKDWQLVVLNTARCYQFLHIPGDLLGGTKWSDPKWRQHFSWVILESPNTQKYYPLVASNLWSGWFGWKLKKPVTTQLFAMRVGRKSYDVLVINEGGQVEKVQFYGGARNEWGCPIFFDTEQAVDNFALTIGESITCI